MKIAVGNDHRGVAAKNRVVDVLTGLGHAVTDLGAPAPPARTTRTTPSRWPRRWPAAQADRGILICATGHGMCIAANSKTRTSQKFFFFFCRTNAIATRRRSSLRSAVGDWVAEVVARGETKATVVAHDALRFDLRVVPEECFGNVLQHFTGAKDHNIALREDAQRRGLSISEYGVTTVETGEDVTHATEDELYEYLGYRTPAPELREGTAEIAAARNWRPSRSCGGR